MLFEARLLTSVVTYLSLSATLRIKAAGMSNHSAIFTIFFTTRDEFRVWVNVKFYWQSRYMIAINLLFRCSDSNGHFLVTVCALPREHCYAGGGSRAIKAMFIEMYCIVGIVSIIVYSLCCFVIRTLNR